MNKMNLQWKIYLQTSMRTKAIRKMKKVDNRLMINKKPMREPVGENNLRQLPESGTSLGNSESLKPPKRFDDYLNIEEICIAEGNEPISYKGVINCCESKQRRSAMREEMGSLIQNQVWEMLQ